MHVNLHAFAAIVGLPACRIVLSWGQPCLWKGAVHVARVGSSATLVDLTAVSLAELRSSADPVLEQSRSRMLREAGDPWFEALKLQSATGGSNC
jgi:hypothetical protein